MRAATAAMGALFLAAFVWIYGPAFPSVLHSDVAVNVLMAARELATRSPVARDFYFVNGDIWVFDPHQLAVPLVAVFGPSTTTLRLMLILSTLVELVVVYVSFRRLTQRRAVALLGAVAVLALWSRLSALFVYVEPSYGFLATVYLAAFTLAAPGTRGWRRELATAAWVFLLTLQNPQRSGVFLLAPLFVATLWPWRGLARRHRVLAVGAAATGFAVATVIYRTILRPGTNTSPLRSSIFAIRDVAGIGQNLRIFARGLLVMAGDSPSLRLGSIAGLVVMVGAIALVLREVLASRVASARRFVCVAVLAQAGAVVLILVLGNLLLDERSVRYLLPSLLLVLGLGAVVAADDGGRAPAAWLVAMPVAAGMAFLRMVNEGIASPADAWAENRDARRVLAAELTRRELTRGFATYWNANVLTLLSGGRTRACSVSFGRTLVPYKWATDTTCFTLRQIPDRFYVASSVAERSAIAEMAPSLPPPVETFDAGGAFTVNVYETARTNMQWLELPLPDALGLRFPFALAASYPAFRRDKSHLDGASVVATGEDGCVVFGPYMDLPSGHFLIRWTGHGVDSPGAIAFDVNASDHPKLLAQLETPSSQFPRESGSMLAALEIDLPAATAGVEFRVYSHNGAKIALENVRIERR